MTSEATLKCNIREALAKISGENFPEAAQELLDLLGYRSERVPPEQTGTVEDFIGTYPAENPGTRSENCLRANVNSVRILFQVTDSELGALSEQSSLFSAKGFEGGNAKSFMFASIETGGGVGDFLPRGVYADLAREVNKRFSMPTVVLFKTGPNLLTLAFVERRQHQRNTNRDVLGRVSLIREINATEPHRAHLDILASLSLENRLEWINTKGKGQNFDGLLEAWLEALDTEKLNRQFYRELFVWFLRAVKEAKFPTLERQVLSPEVHIIRLITRLLFIWFIKEKGLVAKELFVEEQIKHYLKNYDSSLGNSYYRAVLQNLFFATLNTQISQRGFSKRDRSTHRDFIRYRYQDEIADTAGLLNLFSQTPFINGGLFECLDSFENYTAGGSRIDCFTDNVNDPSKREYQILSVPNRLFFDDEGLITLFGSYKFTIEESTPIESEVALDPELLGQVFENLLAAYNPETRETARKVTGSYYTPQAVVNYIVDEALIESMATRVMPIIGGRKFWRKRLQYLLDYEDACDDANTLFDEVERERLVQYISEIKVLDPAVGSGAFPIGILHKLTLMLRRLDSSNEIWAGIQKGRASQNATRAFDTDDPKKRGNELAEISEIFEAYRDSDFGRKIFLIQNSIFGVDIQPIACQIAKLRFFISLAIEQESTMDIRTNYGIRPLPNLETRFVAANTLVGLSIPMQQKFQSTAVKELREKVERNRERHFHAYARDQKWEHRKIDKMLRLRLSKELRKSGFSDDVSEKIAVWEPYDQNTEAEWFEPQYMFGVDEGFDIVIGNPPYIQLQKDGGRLGRLYEKSGYSTFVRVGDIYQLFYEKGCQLLRSETGLLCYITSNSWLKAKFGGKTRLYLSSKMTPLLLLESGKDVFENAVVDTSIFMCRNSNERVKCRAVDMDRLTDKIFPPSKDSWGLLKPEGSKPWRSLSRVEHNIINKMEEIGMPLGESSVIIYRGVTTGYNEAFIIDPLVKQQLINEDSRSAEIIKPVLRGRDVKRYITLDTSKWLIYTRKGTIINNFPAVHSYLETYRHTLQTKAGSNQWYELQSSPGYGLDIMYQKPKLFWRRVAKKGTFAFVPEERYAINAVCVISGESLKFLCAILNSKCMGWYAEPTLPRSGTGTLQWEIAYVRNLPIPVIAAGDQQPFVELVDSIIQAKEMNPSMDTTQQEAEIDRLVYELYGLTEGEIAVVEGR